PIYYAHEREVFRRDGMWRAVGEVARWGVLFHSVVGTVARFHAGDSSPAVMGKFRAGPGDQRESSRNIVGGVQPEKTEGAMYVVHYSRIRGTPAWTR
ncbi:hypothetical protein ACWEOD_11875, partial [Micrococcus luteus]